MELWVEHLLLLRAMQDWAGLSPSLGPTNPRPDKPPPAWVSWVCRAARRVLVWLADGLIWVGTRLKAVCAAASTNDVEANGEPARPGAA